MFEQKINQRIGELFKPELKRIQRVLKCSHRWKEKEGKANYQCSKCGYMAIDPELDDLIFQEKLKERGVTQQMKDDLLKKLKSI